MNVSSPQTEVIVDAELATGSERLLHFEEIKELADVELAYVGGGSGIVIFA